MENIQPSSTFKKLYFNIIDDLLFQICKAKINYCIKADINGISTQIAIWQKFEEYRNKALKKMSGERLDRHKLASCICGAIIEIKPLIGYNDATIVKNANEYLALHVGLNIIKYYMIYAYIENQPLALDVKNNVKHYLLQNFEIQFPDNICDNQEYKANFANALYWSHEKCEISNKECFNYDIWAYSKIFFHLELYNRKYIVHSYEEYLKNSNY